MPAMALAPLQHCTRPLRARSRALPETANDTLPLQRMYAERVVGFNEESRCPCLLADKLCTINTCALAIGCTHSGLSAWVPEVLTPNPLADSSIRKRASAILCCCRRFAYPSVCHWQVDGPESRLQCIAGSGAQRTVPLFIIVRKTMWEYRCMDQRHPIVCPMCAGDIVMRHCPSDSCDLLFCAECHAYGTYDGKRWYVRSDQQIRTEDE